MTYGMAQEIFSVTPVKYQWRDRLIELVMMVDGQVMSREGGYPSPWEAQYISRMVPSGIGLSLAAAQGAELQRKRQLFWSMDKGLQTAIG